VTAPLQRSALTELILAELRKSDMAIGDGVLPDASWIGQPHLPGSEFQPFAVLSELTADRAEGPLGASAGDRRMPYMIECFAISREQVSWVADRLRGSLSAMRFTKLQLGEHTYKVQYVRGDSIGAPQQIDVTYPPFWHQQDNLTVWIGKEVG
jgi:hypothetical protein